MKNIFYLFLSLILFSACQEKIELEVPGSEPILVVEAEVTTELDSSFVRLTLSSNYFGPNAYQTVNNATVLVNNIPFNFDAASNVYKPAGGYVAYTDSTYNLSIVYNGNTYTSSSTLSQMFQIVGDSLFQVFKPKEGFIKEGYSINYIGLDNRPKIKYTYFQLGYFDTIAQRDSFSSAKILFNNDVTPVGAPYPFELPFTRLQPGEEFFCIFRSCDRSMNDFIAAFNTQSSGAPGPFQVPAANLPTNIVAPKNQKAVGYFATYDVKRYRYTVK